MPELPEVQTVADDLNRANLTGLTITVANCYWPRTCEPLSENELQNALVGRTIVRFWRRAKYLIADLAPTGHIVIHLRMTGRLHLVPQHIPREKHEHVICTFSDGQTLRLHDTRKFARFCVYETLENVLGHLGREPLQETLDSTVLQKLYGKRSRAIKALLLDQNLIAGIGNIYADEALWEARIHPATPGNTLEIDAFERLAHAIPVVLRRGLANMGTSLGSGAGNFYSVAYRQGRNEDDLRVFRRTGMACPRCGTTIVRLVVAQRGTHICPACQVFTAV
ncbi:bifunctional DNA-formamidopyrimidine glycosylase/DNA-(apurinic or apyrimidinic site) lyase [Chrysiogenes arsenatis]|uniref:bifunctional DNA-formamidopyrimidine glycosylase/DNA-(apurinic or apyrimidinic site) lyase n=1 Tax=Chrysiogenes arsenatis TaxID=309797 RepID=UPI0003FD2A44|nr:bifunctional DNA-formamidopyrimidine glycosylase/DNA-(apurinic or apyrimidinic site) lyase [Chrysiogenes arsenatis]